MSRFISHFTALTTILLGKQNKRDLVFSDLALRIFLSALDDFARDRNRSLSYCFQTNVCLAFLQAKFPDKMGNTKMLSLQLDFHNVA